MKFLFVSFLSLVCIKAITYLTKLEMSKQKKEIDEFIWAERQRKEAEFSMYNESIHHAFRNSTEIPLGIAPKDSLKEGRPVYPFKNFHDYLTFLVDKNPGLGLDTIKSINLFPDSLHRIVHENNAVNEIFKLYKDNNWLSSQTKDHLKGIINSIKPNGDNLEIDIQPLLYSNPVWPFYISINAGKEIFYTIPFSYTGDIQKISLVVTNPVTNEDQIITAQ